MDWEKDIEMRKEALKSFKEFDIVWTEYFKDKPEPKDDDEDRKQQEEFYHWYNYIRKQSDTGKTPVEMHKEAYGEEPKNILDEEKPSRFMYFEWDDYDDEDFEENELDYAQEDAISIATKIFEDSWKQIKQEVDGISKREACKYSFILGFLDYMKMMDQKARIIKKEMENMSKGDFEKMIEKLKENRGGEEE